MEKVLFLIFKIHRKNSNYFAVLQQIKNFFYFFYE